MQQPLISVSNKKEFDRLTRNLCLKSAQIIVQGRLGRAIASQCNPMPISTEWFNLTIKDYPEIQKEAKKALSEGNPNFQSSFVVEISLRTSDSESLLLEVWSLGNTPRYEDVMHQTVFRRMSLFLRSTMCISRATPAYKLSRKQGLEYVICFRICSGKADISGLGEGFKTLKVGSIGTPTGTLTLSVAFRTDENLHLSTKRMAPATGDQMKVNLDHFYSPRDDTTPYVRPCHTLRSRLMNSREFLSDSKSSSRTMESPSYFTLPTSFSTSPGEPGIEPFRQKGAVFTIGTPPASGHLGRTPISQLSSPVPPGAKRKLCTASRDRLQIATGNIHSQSEQHLFDPTVQYRERHSQRRNTVQEEIFFGQKHLEDNRTMPASVSKESSVHTTFIDDKGVFRPISYSPSDDTKQFSLSKPNDALSLALSSQKKFSLLDNVKMLRSNSPSNAKFGFPDNSETTPHASHISQSSDIGTTSGLSSLERLQQSELSMPSTGAFVSNSKVAKRAFDLLNEIWNEQNLPFDNLLASCGSKAPDRKSRGSVSKGATRDSSSDTSPESIRVISSTLSMSSHSCASSLSGGESSPCKDVVAKPLLDDQLLMVQLDPAFARNDSVKDLCAFYRQIDNAADLFMFKENNGQETQDTLMDLIKQLEDYQTDAEDFDEFVRELEIAS